MILGRLVESEVSHNSPRLDPCGPIAKVCPALPDACSKIAPQAVVLCMHLPTVANPSREDEGSRLLLVTTTLVELEASDIDRLQIASTDPGLSNVTSANWAIGFPTGVQVPVERIERQTMSAIFDAGLRTSS
eukprot:CAMPEP_0204088360 /NCGR_PEP_ID=MMETSP0360-20130528/186075_1 /ASSEMBLY_ACC=CAM_ASM_000342 /TAXON_ID=268821 /ORGANISM="Scrippsiella Hangoei, Strain SHTV-5" /LENGTH=131 /DNA_ID=CAMNT_0051037539 /DNA_START=64 /DNA_END=460 /DNA_ORIENTATION=-